MIRSHKARLTLAASAATGLLLAMLFGAVLLIASQSALNQRQSELKSASRALAGDSHQLEVDEFDESHPEMSFTVFNQDGSVALQHGRFHLQPTIGLSRSLDVLSFGIERGQQVVVVASDWRETSRGLRRLGLVLGLLWLPLTLLAGLVTWLTARSVFEPLERLTEQAASSSGTSLSDRLKTTDQAEFGVFALHLNRMLDRIEETVHREDQFAADAAHELRTPLAILRTRIETTLLRERTPAEYVASNQQLLGELDRLTRIVEALMRTARRIPTDVEPIELEQCLVECTTRWQDQFVAAEVFLAVETVPAHSRISREEFAVVIDNLLDNALRFSAKGSTVWVGLFCDSGQVSLTVKDEGPGIPAQLGSLVFERFVRSEDDRNRSSGGAGIGLAVCKKILTSRGGSIEIHRSDSSGTTIACHLSDCSAQ